MTDPEAILDSVFSRAILEGNVQAKLAIYQVFFTCIDSSTIQQALLNGDQYLKWVETRKRNIIQHN